jgi:polynucleotide 5'-hydroxyl-kinase GRC3/NOL9
MTFDISTTWVSALESIVAAARPTVVCVIGGVDAGKTMLCAYLANALTERGVRTAIVDADVGQSDIGPPSTIGWGLIDRPMSHLSEVHCSGCYFVGSTAPVGLLLPTVIGAKKMTDAALNAGAEVVIVDTTGLVHGSLGRELKSRKIEMLMPSFVLALQRQSELEAILRGWENSACVKVLRLNVSPQVSSKSQNQRQSTREEKFRQHFASAQSRTIPLEKMTLRETWLLNGKPLPKDTYVHLSRTLRSNVLHAEQVSDTLLIVADAPVSQEPFPLLRSRFNVTGILVIDHSLLVGLLAGLLDEEENCLGLGLVEYFDFVRRQLRLLTPVADVQRIARVVFGRIRLNRQGEELGKLRAGEM